MNNSEIPSGKLVGVLVSLGPRAQDEPLVTFSIAVSVRGTWHSSQPLGLFFLCERRAGDIS